MSDQFRLWESPKNGRSHGLNWKNFARSEIRFAISDENPTHNEYNLYNNN